MQTFTIHEKSGAGGMYRWLAIVTLITAPLDHVVFRHWSLPAAWIASGLTLVAAGWMLAVARSFAQYPIVVTDREVQVRAGILLRMEIPREAIVHAGASAGDPPVQIPPLAVPNVLLEFDRYIEVRKAVGPNRRTRSVGISVDDAGGFLKAISKL